MKNNVIPLFLLTGILYMAGCQDHPRQVSAFSGNGDTRDTVPFQIEITDLSVRDSVLHRIVDPVVSSETQKLNKSGNTDFTLLSTSFFYGDDKGLGQQKDQREFQVKSTLFDYSTNTCKVIFGTFDTLRHSFLIDSTRMTEDPPIPEDDEFNTALTILISADPDIARAIREKQTEVYMPMPPTDPKAEYRTLLIGLLHSGDQPSNKIVGINMKTRKVIHYPKGAFPGSFTDDATCGLPDIDRNTTRRGTAGQYQLHIRRHGEELWSMEVIRPAASSGKMGSGIEIMNVTYKGVKILQRAGVPILTVRYDKDACGPFRDWQYKETRFTAIGDDIAAGIRLCKEKPITALDEEATSDKGNFRGVAIYETENEVILISEMEAGWYRYVSEWRFQADGTFLPRFGFGAVKNSCVCKKHYHHAYWRLDFDLSGPSNSVEEFVAEDSLGTGTWQLIKTESTRIKNKFSKWRVNHFSSNSSFEIIPGKADGVQDADFGRGDFWVLAYQPNHELEDGQGKVYFWDELTGSRIKKAAAKIDRFLNNESVDNTDIVIWYAGHFTHDIQQEASHIIGPIIRPVNPRPGETISPE